MLWSAPGFSGHHIPDCQGTRGQRIGRRQYNPPHKGFKLHFDQETSMLWHSNSTPSQKCASVYIDGGQVASNKLHQGMKASIQEGTTIYFCPDIKIPVIDLTQCSVKVKEERHKEPRRNNTPLVIATEPIFNTNWQPFFQLRSSRLISMLLPVSLHSACTCESFDESFLCTFLPLEHPKEAQS
eukprot:jgi/Psemu1/8149/gm1.8149_g